MKSVKNKLHFTKCIIHVFFKMYTCDEHDDTHVFMTLDAYDIMILNVITFMQLNHSYKDNILNLLTVIINSLPAFLLFFNAY